MSDGRTLWIKVGNSNVSARLGKRKTFSWRLNDLRPIDLEGLNSDRLVVASVVPEMTDRLRVWATQKQIPFHLLDTSKTLLDLPYEEGLGLDRALNVLGLVSQGLKRFVCMDIGTAVTVEFYDQRWLGGWIFPSPYVALSALHEKTAQLPSLVPPSRLGQLQWGRSSEACMQKGVQATVEGAMSRAIDLMKRRGRSKKFDCVITGDGGKSYVTKPWQYQSDLLFEGMWNCRLDYRDVSASNRRSSRRT
jgi:pantothenate kinase type III